MHSKSFTMWSGALILLLFGLWPAVGALEKEPNADPEKDRVAELSLRTADEATSLFNRFGFQHMVFVEYTGPLASVKIPRPGVHLGGRNRHSSLWYMEVFGRDGKPAYNGSCQFITKSKTRSNESNVIYSLKINGQELGLVLSMFADEKHKMVDLDTVVCRDGRKLTDVLATFPAYCAAEAERAEQNKGKEEEFWDSLDAKEALRTTKALQRRLP